MDVVFRCLDVIWKIISVIVSIMLGSMAVLVFVQVISRFLLHFPITWSEELAKYLLVWVSFLGSCLGIRAGRMIGITALVNVIPKRGRKIFGAAAILCLIGFLTFLIVYGTQMALVAHNQISSTLPIRLSIAYAAIPAGAIFMLLAVLEIPLTKRREAAKC